MTMHALRDMLRDARGNPPIGTWIMAASPLVAEAMGVAGFAWGVIDMEHTPLDMMEVVQLLQAVGATPMRPIVRVPWNDTVVIKRVLDAGAQTLLVPFVQNAAQAQTAVAATRYPPQGVRGMAGMSRASRFGTTARHFEVANDSIGVIVQLETPEAIGNVDAIAAVPGVDALFIGPGDLSGAIGHPGQVMHPDALALTERAVARAKAAGLPIGTVGGSTDAVAQYRRMGFDFIGLASDLGLLMRAAQGALATLHAGTSPAPAPATSPAASQGGY
jgi:2-keto-3-deoxy-L-rhamnonate aldolase RhmA